MFVPLLGIKPLLSGVTTGMNSNLDQCKAALLATGHQLYLLYHLASFLLFVVTGVNMLTVIFLFPCKVLKTLIILIILSSGPAC
jgi:glucan phosphoethanolaminetransferase (alkaline phosphatase superfamily)